MKFAKFLRITFYRTPPVAASKTVSVFLQFIFSVIPINIWITLFFFYKNNFIRTRASDLTKSQEQAKNNPRLTFPKN